MTSKALFAAALLTTVGASLQVEAFEVKHAADGELVRWRQGKVTWTIDPSVRRVPGGESAVVAAIDAWTQRAGAPVLTVGATDADLEPGLDGTNAVFFAPGGYAPAGDALAITVLSFSESTGEVLDADIVLNGRYELGPVDPSAHHPTSAHDRGAQTYDVARIVAHEMGHALGLSDERGRPDALMYPFVARARAFRAKPASDDLQGLQMLYGHTGSAAESASEEGSDAKSGGCGSAVVASSGPSPAPATACVAAGLVIAALVMARSERRGGRSAAGCTLLAAAGLVVLPPTALSPASPARAFDTHAVERAAFDATAVVTSVHTSSVHGVFRSEVELAGTTCESEPCPATGRAFVWGGSIDGVRQIVGDAHVPVAGERVGVTVRAAE